MKKQISHILRKGKLKNAKETDRQEMIGLFHQPETEFELKDNLLKELNIVNAPDTYPLGFRKLFAKLWATIEKSKVQSKPKTKFLYSYILIAAVLVVGLFIVLYTASDKPKQEPVYYAMYSPPGSISEMILPDGSVIFLNYDSRIKYSIEGEKGIREIFLDGEAWFHVKKNKKEPFIVHTSFYDVNVTGTKFNVKAYDSDNKITTTLEEGEVVISSSENFIIPGETILKPGEQIIMYKDSKKMTINRVDTHWFTSWKDNKFIFVNMSLKELIGLLERKYGVDIEVENKTILDYHYDGVIKNETIIEVLEIVKQTLPIRYEITGRKIQILTK